jgi:hypothetical protein
MADANIIRRKKEAPPAPRHKQQHQHQVSGGGGSTSGHRRNFSVMMLLLTASAIVTLVTSFINLHLLSVVMTQQDNGVLHELVNSGGGDTKMNMNTNNIHSSSSNSSSSSTGFFRDDGTYWTDDVDNPSYIDIQNDEEPILNPPLPDGNTTFGACLLVMDDNHRLVEWLAYHYYVLPLRFLIITTDPRSRTSPTHVLNRWRRMGTYILEWNDFDFLKPSLARHPVPDDARLEDKRARHRIRQRQFFRKCLQVSKAPYNRSYVALIDTDEYIMYNHKGGDGFEAWEEKQLELHKTNKETKRKTRIRPSSTPPMPSEEGAMIKYIRREEAAGTPFFQGPCISAPRLQIGAIESNTTDTSTAISEHSNTNYGDVVDPDRFETLRFKRHGPRQEFVNNRLAKCIVDVTRVDEFPEMATLHRPIKTICPPPWRNEWDSGLRVYHYLGTWEGETDSDG